MPTTSRCISACCRTRSSRCATWPMSDDRRFRPGRQPLPLGGAGCARRRAMSRAAHLVRGLLRRRSTARPIAASAARRGPHPGAAGDPRRAATVGAAAIHLEFAGGAAIRLEVARIQCRADDLGEPWPTPWHPRHRRRGAGKVVCRAARNDRPDPGAAQRPHPRRGDAAAAPDRHRARAGLRRSGVAPAALRDQRSRPRRDPRAQLRRRDLRRLRRGAARRRRQRRADGIRLFRNLRAARSRHRALPHGGRGADGWVGARRPARWSHVRVATKYPEITRRHFAARGVQAECIKLNGAIELAPSLGPVPPYRRSGADRRDAEGERPRRDRAHRRRSPRASSSTARR